MKNHFRYAIIVLIFFYLPIQGFTYAADYNMADAKRAFEYKFYEWNNRAYELTGRLILINKSKAMIHLPRRNYGYTKFIYANIELSDNDLAIFKNCENLCFFSGNFTFSGSTLGSFGSEYQIDANLIDFKMGLNEDLIPQNRKLFSDLKKLRELFTSTSERNDGRFPPTFFFEFGQDELDSINESGEQEG